MSFPALFWIFCAVVALATASQRLPSAYHRYWLTRDSDLFPASTEVAARTRFVLWLVFFLKGVAFLLIGLVSLFPHVPIPTEVTILTALFMFIALCLATITILLALSEDDIRSDNREVRG